MPYCITLRSRADARITGWYDGTDSRWSTDYKRQKLFDKKHDARPVCDELRRRCPRDAGAINIEAEQNDASLDQDAQPRERQFRERVGARNAPLLPIILDRGEKIGDPTDALANPEPETRADQQRKHDRARVYPSPWRRSGGRQTSSETATRVPPVAADHARSK